MATDLPDDCWELIFSYLDPHFNEHLPINYVCKNFLNINNKSRAYLHFPSTLQPVPSTLPPILYARFPNLTNISLDFVHPHIDHVIRQLAASSVRLQNLSISSQRYFPRDAMRILAQSMKKTLRSLACSSIDQFSDAQVFVIANCFTYLHHLSFISNRSQGTKHFLTNEAVRAISEKIVSLSSFSISLHSTKDKFSPTSFDYLGSNCHSLSELNVYSDVINQVDLFWFSSFKYLKTLNIRHVNISNSGLIYLSKTGNLKSLRTLIFYLPNRTSTIDGSAMCRFLKSCPSLTILKLYSNFIFSPDTIKMDFAPSIAKSIRIVTINDCVNLPTSILYNLLKSSPRLEEVWLSYSETVIDEDSFDLSINYYMRSLYFFSNTLSDKALKLICCSCPKLKSFQIHGYSRITIQGAKTIFRENHGSFNCLKISKRSDGLQDFNLYEDDSPCEDDLWCNVLDDGQSPFGEEYMKDLLIAYGTEEDSEGSQ